MIKKFRSSQPGVLSWAMYDWANSAFSTTVMAAFFPIFFKNFWSQGDVNESTIRLGLANSLLGLGIALSAPLLGAIADKLDLKKGFLIFFASLGFLSTCLLVWPAQGEWRLAAAIYILAGMGFFLANIFYDSLLTDIVKPERFHSVSSLGFSLGYLGGGLLFAVHVIMVKNPAWFGFANATSAVKASFFSVGVWWALFSLPLFFMPMGQKTKGSRGAARSAARGITEGLRQIRQTLSHFKQLKQAMTFLLAYWFYIDGVGTIIRMAADYGLSLGFSSGDLILAILLIQFTGFPCTMIFAKIAGKLGARQGLLFGIAIYLFVTLWASFMTSKTEFYAIALLIGFAQGGLQALSRSYYARMIPADKSGEFFGIYNMFGKFAMILGPLLMAGITYFVRSATGSPDLATRYGMASIAVLFITGAVLLKKVNEEEGRKQAEELRGFWG